MRSHDNTDQEAPTSSAVAPWRTFFAPSRSSEGGDGNGVQDRGAALGSVFFLLGAVGFGEMYQWGPKIIFVNCFAAAFVGWRLFLAFVR